MQDLEYFEKTDKRGKWETHMVGTGIWRENSKTWKIDTLTVEPEIWRGTVKNVKNKKYTL